MSADKHKSFKKALASYKAGMKHAWTHIGFRKSDRDMNDMNAILDEKSSKICKATIGTKGGWGTQRGRL